MKKLLAAVVVIILAWLGWHYYSARKNSPAPIKIQPTVEKPDPSNATFTFEDGPVTLKNGSASSPIAPGSAETQDTTLSDIRAYGDINGDGKNDTVAFLVQESGGTGVFVYAVAYVSGNVQYKGTNAVFVGDRVSPKSISISTGGVVTLSYLDRGPNDPLSSDPTIPTTKQLVFRSGLLVEH